MAPWRVELGGEWWRSDAGAKEGEGGIIAEGGELAEQSSQAEQSIGEGMRTAMAGPGGELHLD